MYIYELLQAYADLEPSATTEDYVNLFKKLASEDGYQAQKLYLGELP